MDLEIGGLYRFRNDRGVIDLKVVDVHENRYDVVIKQNTFRPESEDEGVMQLYKGSNLFTNYKIIRLDKEVFTNTLSKKRRTKDEIEVDNLIEHVQRNFKLNQLLDQINEALDNNDVELFVRISKEYAKLKRKVTA